MVQPVQFFQHPRQYQDFKYAYPVVSRRSRGLSIGVNLNPDKVCNWDCPYCQVDRTSESSVKTVNIDELIAELRIVAEDALTGALWDQPRFKSTPQYLRAVRDFAFAGDGEPTSSPLFATAIEKLAELKAELGLSKVKTIVLTNATLLHLAPVKRGLELLEQAPSDVWCKLDAGSEEYFQKVNRSKFALKHCIDNILALAKRRPVTIQSMFMRLDGVIPSAEEVSRYIDNIRWMASQGGKFKLVQVYTIARTPSESRCQPLTNDELDELVSNVRFALPELDVQGFYGSQPA